MNKSLKYLLISLGVIFVALIALVALVAATFNPNDYKPLIIKLVQEKKQRTLKIEGDIKLTFFPQIGADLGKLSLSEHSGNKEFASIANARVSLAVMPLLKKQLVVDHIRIDGAQIELVRYADGSTSIDDLLKKEEESEQFKFDIEGVSVTHAGLAIDDQMGKRKLVISDLEFNSSRLANNQPGQIDLKFDLKNSRPKVDSKIKLTSGLLFDIDAKSFSLSKLMLSLAGKVDENDLDIALSVPAVDGKGSAIKSDQLTLEVSNKQNNRAIKGQISSLLSADLDKQQFNLDKLSINFNLSNAAMPKAVTLNLGGAAKLDLAKQKANLDLSGKLDDSQVKAQLGMSHFDAPAYDFNINIDKLDVDQYLSSGKPEEKSTQVDQSVDFGFLRALKANGQLSIGTLNVSNIKSSNIKLNIKAGDGNLNVAPMSASFYQGTLNGAVSLHGTGTPGILLKQNLVGVNVGPMLKDVANVDMLEGRGNVALDVHTQGSTVSAMKKALQGQASLNLQDGALKGINIVDAIQSAKAKLGSPQGEATKAANGADKTGFSELTASFQIAKGNAHNEDLSAKSPLLRLTGNGDVNIGESTMNYLAKATVVASLEGQGGKDLSALKGVTVPVRITGPFSGLKYSLDFNSMVSDAAKQKIEQKKDEVKAKLGGELKNSLKGLFK